VFTELTRTCQQESLKLLYREVAADGGELDDEEVGDGLAERRWTEQTYQHVDVVAADHVFTDNTDAVVNSETRSVHVNTGSLIDSSTHWLIDWLIVLSWVLLHPSRHKLPGPVLAPSLWGPDFGLGGMAPCPMLNRPCKLGAYRSFRSRFSRQISSRVEYWGNNGRSIAGDFDLIQVLCRVIYIIVDILS